MNTRKPRKPKSKPPLEPEVLDEESSDETPELSGEPDFDAEIELTEPDENRQSLVPSGTGKKTSHLPVDLTDKDLAAISPADPLRRYMEEVRRYPLLEPEEEFRLAIQLRDEGNLEAAKTMVSANLRLVVKIAMEYRSLYSNILDLIQEGNVGLMKAVSKFDPTKGVRLGYYASWWIRSYILKYILDNFRLVKIGTTQAQKKLFYHLVREKERLEAQGLLAGPKLLAEKLDVTEKDIIEMDQRLSGRGAEVSLDSPLQPDDDRTTRLDQLTDSGEAADSYLEREQLIQLLKNHLDEFQGQLNAKEKMILKDRLLSEDPKTLQEIANVYGLTRERARQIETQVISKLRDFLKPSFGRES